MHDNVKLELLETIKEQDDLINQQSKTIMCLVNETVEQEAIITELMKSSL